MKQLYLAKVFLLGLLLSTTGALGAVAQEVLFYESFDQCTGTGGNDGVFKGIKGANSVTYDTPGWSTNTNINGANKCIRTGSGKSNGSIITPALNLNGNAVLTFKAASWDGDKTNIDIKIDGGGKLEKTKMTITPANAAFSEHSIKIINGTKDSKITFSSGKGKRFFLDEVKIVAKDENYIDAPTFSIPSGSIVEVGTQVELIMPDNARNIIYTTDGSEPNSEYKPGEYYEGPIAINADMTIKAIAVGNNANFVSAVATASYTVKAPEAPAAPTFSVASGAYTDHFEVTITAPEGCMVLYTTDGTDPSFANENGELDDQKVTLPIVEDVVIKAISVRSSDEMESAVATASYKFVEAITTLKQLQDAGAGIHDITLTNAQVLNNVHNRTAYLYDGTAGVALYKTNNMNSYTAGQVLNGTATVTLAFYNGMPEITKVDNLSVTATEGTVNYTPIAAKDAASHVMAPVSLTDELFSDNGLSGIGYFEALKPSDDRDYLYVGARISAKGIITPYEKNNTTSMATSYQFVPIEPTVYRFSDKWENTYHNVGNASVELTRTVTADAWNAVAFPFSIEAEDVPEVFGEGTLVAEFVGDSDGTMRFESRDNQKIVAGEAVLVKPATTVTSIKLDDVYLYEPTIKTTTGTNYDFVGTLNNTPVAQGVVYFVAGKNAFKTIGEAGGNIKPFRGYLQPTTAEAKAVTFCVDGEATAIVGLDASSADEAARQPAYNLAGQRVHSSYRGIVVRQGKKYLRK